MYSETERSSELASLATASISSGVTRNFSSSVHLSAMISSNKKKTRISQRAEVRRLVRQGRFCSCGTTLRSAHLFPQRMKRDIKVGRCLVGFAVLEAPDGRLRTFALIGNVLIRQTVIGDVLDDFFCCIHAPNYTRVNSLVNARMDNRLRK